MNYHDVIHFADMLIPNWIAEYGGPEPLTLFPWPKPSGSLRQLALLSVRDLAFTHAAAGAVAKRTDRRLSRHVYSSRLVAQPPAWRTRQKPFKRFRRDAQKRIKLWQCEGMVRTDVRDYYPSIPVEQLLRQLWDAGCDREAVTLLINMVMWWQDRHSVRGLPVGPEAFGIPGSFYLHPLDQVLEQVAIDFFRYTDDVIYLFGNGDKSGNRISDVDEILANLGLQRAQEKTQLYNDPTEALEAVARQEFDYLGAYLTFGPPESIESVKRMFDRNVVEVEPPDIAAYKWAVPVFMNREDTYAIRSIADNSRLFDIDAKLSADYMLRCGRTDQQALESLLARLAQESPHLANAGSRLHILRVMAGVRLGEVEGRLFEKIAVDNRELPAVRAWAWAAHGHTSNHHVGEVLDAAIAEQDRSVRRAAILTLRSGDGRGRRWAARCFAQKYPADSYSAQWACAA